MSAVSSTGERKLFAAAGCTSIWTVIASGSVTCIVIVAGILSEFLRIQSVNRPTVTTPSLDAVNDTVRELGVPPSETGGSSGISLMTVVPAPGPAVGSTVG